MISAETVEAALLRGRRAAEARFTETFAFFTETDGTDPVTLQPVKMEIPIMVGDTPASSVPGRIKSASRDSRDVPIAGQEPVVSQLVASVAVGSVKVGPSVFIRVVTSTSDPGLVGSKYRTKDYPTLGQVTAWRYPVEQVS